MATIKSATYGDTSSAVDVTSSILGKMSNGTITRRVDDTLLPIITGGNNKAELTTDEQEEIKAQAEKECSSGSDTQCINATISRISESKLQEKITAQQQLGAIKGSRLTVTYVDSRGREQSVIVPKGQTLNFGANGPFTPKPTPPSTPVSERITNVVGGLAKYGGGSIAIVFTTLTSIAAILLWAFSIGATWRAFAGAGYRNPAYVATAAAVIFPFSGFIITPVFYAFLKYFAESK
jgi:hypothetical protein